MANNSNEFKTVFVASRRKRGPGASDLRRIEVASFFSFNDLKEFTLAEQAVRSPEGWISDPIMVRSVHGISFR